LPFVAAAVVVWWLAWKQWPQLAMLAIAVTMVFASAYVKRNTFAQLDRSVSVREFWRAHPEAASGCLDGVRREWEYGLNYYAGHPLPPCDGSNAVRIVERDRALSIE
jgi:hypothetical protein